MKRTAAIGIAALLLLGAAPALRHVPIGAFGLNVAAGPYFPGSVIRLEALGAVGPVVYSALGGGTLENGTYVVPAVDAPSTETLVASASRAIATAAIRLAPAPSLRPFVAVASYDNGIALHDARTFALLGYLATSSAVGDVAVAPDGRIFAPDTDGTTMVTVERKPWRVRTTANVLAGNEVVYDARTHAAYVSDRDAEGGGAVTKIPDDGGPPVRVHTGVTPEGLALDASRSLLYAGNVNDASVAVLDTRTMRVVRRIPSVQRTFGIALDAAAQRLYVVSNTTRSAQSAGGFVAAIDLRGPSPHVVRRSPTLRFPLGAALDARRSHLFVTDESANVVYVLDPLTLGVTRVLPTCRTPWRPHVDGRYLYIPCMRSNAFDVYTLDKLRRLRGAPFVTGGTPLGVASWNERGGGER